MFVTASGIDYYGDAGDAVVDEELAAGARSSHGVCVDWEAAAAAAPVRRVAVRTALVVGPGAPALRMMALPFRLFVGGPLGSGRQFFPWIQLDDLVGIYRRAIDDDVARRARSTPSPPSSSASATPRGELGAVLHRPAILPTPGVRRCGSRSGSRPTCCSTASGPSRAGSAARVPLPDAARGARGRTRRALTRLSASRRRPGCGARRSPRSRPRRCRRPASRAAACARSRRPRASR